MSRELLAVEDKVNIAFDHWDWTVVSINTTDFGTTVLVERDHFGHVAKKEIDIAAVEYVVETESE